MQPALDYLTQHHDALVHDLAALVAIPSISTDGEHQKEIEQSAALTCEQMRQAGLQNVDILRSGNSNPYAYGEWLGAPGKPTIFLYAHHDVQPINFVEDWKSEPWKLTERDGRFFGRGAADDKGAITAQLGAIAAYLQTQGQLPVNVKMLVEGEEEIGSSNLNAFFQQYQERIRSDVIIVCDTENVEAGIPSLTYSLRGIVAVQVEVESAKLPIHSGMGGGLIADAALGLNMILARLFPKNGKLPIPNYYDAVRPITAKERRALKKLPWDEAKLRHELGIPAQVQFTAPKNVHPYEQTWRKPAITIIAQEASSIKGASNQVLPRASAIVSCRIVPDQDPQKVLEQLQAFLTKDPPWGVKVTVRPQGSPVQWWMTDPEGPAFDAALKAMKTGFSHPPAAIGCGGTIGFVGPLAELFGGAPALLLGIEDPQSNAHAPNESLHAGDFRKLMASLVHLFQNLGKVAVEDLKKKPGEAVLEQDRQEPVTGTHPEAAPQRETAGETSPV